MEVRRIIVRRERPPCAFDLHRSRREKDEGRRVGARGGVAVKAAMLLARAICAVFALKN